MSKAKRLICVRIDQKEYQLLSKLSKLSKLSGFSMSSLLRYCIIQYLPIIDKQMEEGTFLKEEIKSIK